MNKTVCMSINISIRLLWIITMPRQENDPRIKNVSYVITKVWIIFLPSVFLEHLVCKHQMSCTRNKISAIKLYIILAFIAMIKDPIGYGT